MDKVDYGVKCKVCKSSPNLLELATVKGMQYICVCPKCPQPIRGYVMRSSIEEARWDWKVSNEDISARKLAAAEKVLRFLIELDTDQGVTIPNERMIEMMQFMVTERVFDLFGAATTTATRMLRAGVIKPPPAILLRPRRKPPTSIITGAK